MMTIKEVINLLRVQQWVKNLFIFLPLFFDGKLFEPTCWANCFIAFIAMCFACSSIYCFNDIMDVEQDRLHPQKCKRPIASGKISKRQGYFLMSACFLLTLVLSFLYLFFTYGDTNAHPAQMIYVLLIYWIMNLLYTLRLKHTAIVDVFIVATGFVLRIVIGGLVCSIYISHWIILMTFLLALLLAFAKRRDDLVTDVENTAKIRKSSASYSIDFLNQTLGIIATATLVCYIMYSVSSEVTQRFNTQYLYITSVWVLAGILRYLKLTIVDNKSFSPTKILLQDRFIQICILCWIINFAIIIYL